jgi:hypothetical protein
MKAQVVHAHIDPARLDEAAASVRLELAPQFLAQPGARHGYWMADPSTGRLLELKVWDDASHLEAAAESDRAQRAAMAERLGFDLCSVKVLDVVGAREEEMSDEPDVRFARVTSVEGVIRDPHGRVPGLYREVVPDQARSRGFCASYWLADPSTGGGMAISLWEGAARASASRASSERRRIRFEQLLGCKVDSINEYEALGVASRSEQRSTVPVPVPRRHRPVRQRDVSVPMFHTNGVGDATNGIADRGTSLDRPPGALLAVAGDQAREVIVLLDGQATAVNSHGSVHLVPGAHFGAYGVVNRRAHTRTVVATSPVDLLVFSRSEFATMAVDMPSVTDYLIAEDVDR